MPSQQGLGFNFELTFNHSKIEDFIVWQGGGMRRLV
jgi:hypothetical protein